MSVERQRMLNKQGILIDKRQALEELNALLDENSLTKLAQLHGHAHEEADKILCDFLISLGHQDVVDAYNAVEPKWYD